MATLNGQQRSRVGVPEDLESANAKLIYLYLRTCGNSTLEDLNADLNVPILSLCSLLKDLERRDLITRQGRFYRPTNGQEST